MGEERPETPSTREEVLRELTRRVMAEDAELLERLGRGPSELDQVLDEELPPYDDAMKRLGE